ncbi:MAG: zinc ribbon domain-containing protein [Ktedonobacteraceae bacterium]
MKPVLPLSERTFICEFCGIVLDRDINAAINIRIVAVSSTDTQNACGGVSAGLSAKVNETLSVEAGTTGDMWALSHISIL